LHDAQSWLGPHGCKHVGIAYDLFRVVTSCHTSIVLEITNPSSLTTADFAIRAPKIPGTKTRGPIRLHKTLAWVPCDRIMSFPKKLNEHTV
jgi:hypothetical protein